jgi:hypothetical protein
MVFDPFKNLGVLVSGIDVEEADELLMAMALRSTPH